MVETSGWQRYSDVMQCYDSLLEAMAKIESSEITEVQKDDIEAYTLRFLLPWLKRLGILSVGLTKI